VVTVTPPGRVETLLVVVLPPPVPPPDPETEPVRVVPPSVPAAEPSDETALPSPGTTRVGSTSWKAPSFAGPAWSPDPAATWMAEGLPASP
jgi:hypothetical protein